MQKNAKNALGSAFQSFGGVDLYPSIEEKAAKLAYGIAMNHPFAEFFFSLAAGNVSQEELLCWIKGHKN